MKIDRYDFSVLFHALFILLSYFKRFYQPRTSFGEKRKNSVLQIIIMVKRNETHLTIDNQPIEFDIKNLTVRIDVFRLWVVLVLSFNLLVRIRNKYLNISNLNHC